MTVIYSMAFPAFFLPVILVGREESVGLFRYVVNLCQAETVGDFEGLAIDRCTADDVDFFLGSAVGKSLFEGRKYLELRVEG